MGSVTYCFLILGLLFVDQNVFCADNTGWLSEYLIDLSTVLKDGVPSAGIPNVDLLPLNKNFKFATDVFSGDVALQGDLSGFSNYFVNNAVLNPNLSLELDLIFLSTTFEGFYTLNASAYKNIFPLSGSGPIKIYLSFIELSANTTLVGKHKMLQLKDFDFEIKQINAVQVTADGTLKEYGLDKVLAPALKGVLNTVIKMFKPKLETLVNTLAMTDGNLYLRQMTVSKVLEIIKDLVNGSQGTITVTSAGVTNLKKNPPFKNMTGESMKRMWELHPQLLIKPTSL